MRVRYRAAGLAAGLMVLCGCAVPRQAPLDPAPDVAQIVGPSARTERATASNRPAGQGHEKTEAGRGEFTPLANRPITRAALWLKLAPFACDPKSNKGPVTAAWSGSCDNGLPDGSGTYLVLVTPAAQIAVTGTFVHGAPDGPTKIRFPDGDEYDGEFHGGLPNGRATVRFADGGTITGELKDDVWTGKATQVAADGTTEIGHYREGLLEGTLYIQSVHGFRVEAEYRAGKAIGLTSFIFRDQSELRIDATVAGKPIAATFSDANGRRFNGPYVPSTFDAAKPHTVGPATVVAGSNKLGALFVWMMVGTDGRVADAVMVTPKIDPSLADAVLASVRTWRYTPASVSDHAVPSFHTARIPLHWEKDGVTVSSAASDETDSATIRPRMQQATGS